MGLLTGCLYTNTAYGSQVDQMSAFLRQHVAHIRSLLSSVDRVFGELNSSRLNLTELGLRGNSPVESWSFPRTGPARKVQSFLDLYSPYNQLCAWHLFKCNIHIDLKLEPRFPQGPASALRSKFLSALSPVS
jgi:hypothetical protein